jgi:hypothetical protein
LPHQVGQFHIVFHWISFLAARGQRSRLASAIAFLFCSAILKSCAFSTEDGESKREDGKGRSEGNVGQGNCAGNALLHSLDNQSDSGFFPQSGGQEIRLLDSSPLHWEKHRVLRSLFETTRRQGRKPRQFFLDLTKNTAQAQVALYRKSPAGDGGRRYAVESLARRTYSSAIRAKLLRRCNALKTTIYRNMKSGERTRPRLWRSAPPPTASSESYAIPTNQDHFRWWGLSPTALGCGRRTTIERLR